MEQSGTTLWQSFAPRPTASAAAPADWQSVVLCDHALVLEQERGSGRLASAVAEYDEARDYTLLIDDGQVKNNAGQAAPDGIAPASVEGYDVTPAAHAEARPKTACPTGGARRR